MAGFLADVLVERPAQPGIASGQRRLRRLQQRHRVPHVVVRLAQEREVARQRDLAAQRALDDGRGQQALAGVMGLFEKSGVKAHAWRSGRGRRCGCRAHRHAARRWRARCGRPLAVARPVEASKAARPRVQRRDARVVGKGGVGCVHGRLQRGVVDRRRHRPQHRAQRRLAVAEHHRLQHRGVAAQGGLYPLGRDVAAEARDQHVLLAALHMDEAVAVDAAQIAGRPPCRHRRRIAEVAAEQAAGDFELAVRGHAHAGVRQRPPDAAGTLRARQVERLHRAPFGQTVALAGRDAQRLSRARPAAAPTAAPPTATSFSEAGARCPVCIRKPHQARSICGSRIRLCG